MQKNLEFANQLKDQLPETYRLLKEARPVIHEGVSAIVLHGSRGPADHPGPDSDIDLSLIVKVTASLPPKRLEAFLKEVSGTTLSHWNSRVELDLAVVFDIRNCGLKCFNRTVWEEGFCRQGGVDCFGLYKTQKGFHGLVTNAGVQVKLMYPCLKIWERE